MSLLLLGLSIAAVAFCVGRAMKDPDNSFGWTVGGVIFTIVAIGFMFS